MHLCVSAYVPRSLLFVTSLQAVFRVLVLRRFFLEFSLSRSVSVLFLAPRATFFLLEMLGLFQFSVEVSRLRAKRVDFFLQPKRLALDGLLVRFALSRSNVPEGSKQMFAEQS